MERQFTELVEEATGRPVVAYMSQVHVDPDLAVELFMLGPPDGSPAAQDGQPVTALDIDR
jgi:hypothetical protein